MAKKKVTVGSVPRDKAALVLPFLAVGHPSPRTDLRKASHTDPDLVFWVSPEGKFVDALDDHSNNPPAGFEHIVRRRPDYYGFLCGRVAHYSEQQFVVMTIRPRTLIYGAALKQLLQGLGQSPIPLKHNCLVISDDGDLYGTIEDIRDRSVFAETEEEVERAIRDPRVDARMTAARSDAASTAQIDQFLNDSNWQVRRAAAANPGISQAQLDRAMRDKTKAVRLAASENSSLL